MSIRLLVVAAVSVLMIIIPAAHAHTPPIAFVAGFAKLPDGNGAEYVTYVSSLDFGIIAVRLEIRPEGSTDPRLWTAVGVGRPVNLDSSLWSVTWRPCPFSGFFQMRVVAADETGEDPELQPILHVGITDCVITPVPRPGLAAAIAVENHGDDGGMLRVQLEDSRYYPAALALSQSDTGIVDVDLIDLYAPDPDSPNRRAGSYEAPDMSTGYDVTFWIAQSDIEARRSTLSRGSMVVGYAAAGAGLAVVNEDICARVEIDSGETDYDLRIALYPIFSPFIQIAPGSWQLWPNCAFGETYTKIDVWTDSTATNPLRDRARVELSYRSPLPDVDLEVINFCDSDGDWGFDPVVPLPVHVRSGKAVFETSLEHLAGCYAVRTVHQDGPTHSPLPTTSRLSQNFPNPFNSATVIPFDVSDDAPWTLEIFNVIGQQVQAFEGPGGRARHQLRWDGTDGAGNSLASGLYLCRLSVGGLAQTQKMVLLK